MHHANLRRASARSALVAGAAATVLALGPASALAAVTGTATISAAGTTVTAAFEDIATDATGVDVRCALQLFDGDLTEEETDTFLELVAAALQGKLKYPVGAEVTDYPIITGDGTITLEDVDPGTYRATAGCIEVDGVTPDVGTGIVLANTEVVITGPTDPGFGGSIEMLFDFFSLFS